MQEHAAYQLMGTVIGGEAVLINENFTPERIVERVCESKLMVESSALNLKQQVERETPGDSGTRKLDNSSEYVGFGTGDGRVGNLKINKTSRLGSLQL